MLTNEMKVKAINRTAQLSKILRASCVLRLCRLSFYCSPLLLQDEDPMGFERKTRGDYIYSLRNEHHSVGGAPIEASVTSAERASAEFETSAESVTIKWS